MPQSPHRYVFDQLRRRLAELTEALFERAPYCRGGFQNAGTRLPALCRGPANADTVLQQFEHRWPFLLSDKQMSLRDEWELGLMRLLHEVKEPCNACKPPFGSNAFQQLLECSNCDLKVATISEELEKFCKKFAEKINFDTPPHQAAPPQALPAHGTNQDQDEKIRNLERECVSYKEALEEIQKVLENTSNEKVAQDAQIEELEKAKNELRQTCNGLENELKESIDHIEKYAEDLDIGMRWQTAQMAYAALHKYTLARRDRLEAIPAHEDARKDMELKSLCFKHKQVLALMKLGRFVDAEPMAKLVWDRRKTILSANAKDSRLISKDYCDILRRNGKYAEAEREYIDMWYEAMHGWLDTDQEEWKLETASRIGEVMAEQNRFIDAISWHKRVLEQRLSRTPLEVDKAAAAAVKCLVAHRQQESVFTITDHTIINDLERIWKERAPNSEDDDILVCGHELGVRLQNLGRDEEAIPVLLSVWEKRKACGDRLGLDTMATALALIDLSVKTENVTRLETLYQWILRNPTPDQSETDTLWYRYRLGCVQAVLEKWVIAEDNLRKALDRQTQLFGDDDPDTLQYTQVLAEVLRRERRLDDARNFIGNIWDNRQRYPRSVLQAILRIGHLYGDIIMESDSPGELGKAEAILREVWESTSLNISTMMPLASLVPSGDCYGMCLMKRQKFAEARPIFAQVLEWKKWMAGSMEQGDIERSAHLLNRATELAAKKKIYRPPPSSHKLRLRDFLDRWYASTVVAPAIAES